MSALLLLQLPLFFFFFFLFVFSGWETRVREYYYYIYIRTQAYITHCSVPPSLAGPTATSLKMCAVRLMLSSLAIAVSAAIVIIR